MMTVGVTWLGRQRLHKNIEELQRGCPTKYRESVDSGIHNQRPEKDHDSGRQRWEIRAGEIDARYGDDGSHKHRQRTNFERVGLCS